MAYNRTLHQVKVEFVMRLPFTEPVSPRFIYVNPANNRVHLMVPVVGGQEISTDNTCRATKSLKEFFDEVKALQELTAYKAALEFDLQFLENGNQQKVAKEERLTQIHAYIEALPALQWSYPAALSSIMTHPSNLYSMQLRPREPDSLSQVVNPTFSIKRQNDARGQPLSALYNALHSTFPRATIAPLAPRIVLKNAVIAALASAPASFEVIQRTLKTQCQNLFGVSVDFHQWYNGVTKRFDVITKAFVDEFMGFQGAVPTEEYVDALLGICAIDMWQNIPASPFYSGPADENEADKTERLSLLTQFFLAHVNIYCRTKGISVQNFGIPLDNSPALSQELATNIATTLGAGGDVEGNLMTFINEHPAQFGLTRPLNAEDLTNIKQTFTRTYKTITATKENPHMDDFMLLDTTTKGKFVTHQGSICTDFAELVEPAVLNQAYFARIREDFKTLPTIMPHKNEWIQGEMDINVEAILSNIKDDEQFEKLPAAIKDACRSSPGFNLRAFLHNVAKGKQDEAEALLADPARAQNLLQSMGTFTDYSGRTFNCTAYEYAYWAKDTHMQRMLERHMNEETKAQLLTRIDEMERIDAATGKPVGLVYRQQGIEHRSAHFDLAPLITALRQYVEGYDNWEATSNWNAMKAAWMKVGFAQRDVPAHVAHEYCRPDRSFHPTPAFNELTLPRTLKFYNYSTGSEVAWFPLVASNSGLGFNFGLWRVGVRGVAVAGGAGGGGLGRS